MDFLLMSGKDRRAISAAGLSPLHVEPRCLQQFVPRLYPAPFSRAEARNAPRVCSRFVRVRAGACFCARQGTRSEVWSFQISDEKRCIAQKQARPEGLRGKCRHAALRNLARERHCLRPAPCLATFVAATRSATKREQTLALEQGFQAAQQPLQRALVVRQHGQTRRTTLRGAYRVLQKAIDHGSQFVGIDYFPQCTGVA